MLFARTDASGATLPAAGEDFLFAPATILRGRYEHFWLSPIRHAMWAGQSAKGI